MELQGCPLSKQFGADGDSGFDVVKLASEGKGQVGSSNGRRGSGQRRAAKVKSRRRRLAEEEAARERHAQLVAERAGDPRFVQQETFPGGRKIRWDPETPTGAGLSRMLENRLAAFRAKFGRDPGPNEPLFFDPDEDEPTPLSVDVWHEALDEMIIDADQLGIDPAYLKAWRELGYIVTEENRHLFSAADVQAWTDAVEKYQDDEDYIDDDDVDISDMFELLAEQLEAVIQQTLLQRSPEPARLLAAQVYEADVEIVDSGDHDEDDGAPGVSIAFAILAAWTSGAREELDTANFADTVLSWVTTHLGEPIAALAHRAAGILGARTAPDLTVNQLADELGPDFLPALLWLATGLAAEYGDGDASWLRRYDPHTDDD
jgi:hypothetical protein